MRRGALVCGWYGTETLGDKAILAATVGVLETLAPGERMVIASLDPVCSRITLEEMPELARCEIIEASQAMDRVQDFRAVVFGGGPLMGVRPMLVMESIFARAKILGVPGIIAGCGVGPLGSPAINTSIRGLLASASSRIFRDEASRAMAEKLLGRNLACDSVCDDPATAWVASQRTSTTAVTSNSLLALGLRDWPHRQYAASLGLRQAERIKHHFESTLIRSLEMLLIKRPELRVLPIPFCTHHAGGDDRLLYWRLVGASKLLRSAFDMSLMSREFPPREYVSLMRRCDAILTMRFHSLVFASALGLPAVAIDYTLGRGKTYALGKRIGCPTLPLDRVTPEVLLESLLHALDGHHGEPLTGANYRSALVSAWMESVAMTQDGSSAAVTALA
jgi:polysaccharide pyruvyl transferase WcaK-like protein